MPPRKRARGGSTTTPRGRGRGRGRSTSVASTRTTRSTTTPGPAPSDDPTTPLLTQRRTRTTTAQASPYRTRHRRAVRGPEIAALEGGEEDLVPPSDDDEYDAWRLSRRDSRSIPREDALQHAEAEAGPSRRFCPLFDDESYASSASFSGSESDTAGKKGKGKAKEVEVEDAPRRSPRSRRSNKRRRSPSYSPDAGMDMGIDGDGPVDIDIDIDAPDPPPRSQVQASPTSVSPQPSDAEMEASRATPPVPLHDRPNLATESGITDALDMSVGDGTVEDGGLAVETIRPALPVSQVSPRSSSRSPAPQPLRQASPSPHPSQSQHSTASRHSQPSPPQATSETPAKTPTPFISKPTSPPRSQPLPLPETPHSATRPQPHAHSSQHAINLSTPRPIALSTLHPPTSTPHPAPAATKTAHGRTSSSLPPASPSPSPATTTQPPVEPSHPMSGIPRSQASQAIASQQNHRSERYVEESQWPLGISQNPLQGSPQLSQQSQKSQVEEESQLPLGMSQRAESPDLGGYDSAGEAPMDVDEAPKRQETRVRSPGLYVEIPRLNRTKPANQPPRAPPRSESPDPLDFLAADIPTLSPDSPRASRLLSQRTRQSERDRESLDSTRARPPPSPPATGGSQNTPQPAPAAPASEVSAPPQDPALLQFRITRTFRTRTALQLQPYTREKQLYERALQRGGLTKGKRAIAPAAVVAANRDTDTSDSADQSDPDDDTLPAPEAIVIGGTQERERRERERKERRERRKKPVTDEDLDEYFSRFGSIPDEEDDETAKRLQVIVRERLRAEKEKRRAARAAEATRRGFEALMAGQLGDADQERRAEKEEREKEKAERERKRAQRDKERAEREKRHKEKIASKHKDKAADKNKHKASVAVPARQNGKSRGPRVYGKRANQNQPRKEVNFDDDSSELSDPPPSDSEARRPPARASEPAPDSPTAFLRGPSLSPLEGMDMDMDLGMGMDVDQTGPETLDTESAEILPPPRTQRRRRMLSSSSASDSGAGQPSSRRPRAPAPASNSDSEPNSNSGSGSSPEDHIDKRERIARRMLPGVMLKRLAQAEKDKQKRRAAAAAAKRRTVSPVRPGHAVRRRTGAADVDLRAVWDDESDDEPEYVGRVTHKEKRKDRERRDTTDAPATSRRKSRDRSRDLDRSSPTAWRAPRRDPDEDLDEDLLLEPDVADVDLSFDVYGSAVTPSPPSGTAGAPIPFDLSASDGSGSERERSATPTPPIVISSGSEAEEDNAETLAFLHRGDFESILRGRSAAAVIRPWDHKHQADRERRRKRKPRPVLQRRPLTDGDGLVQARLNLRTTDARPWSIGAVPEPGAIGVAKRTGGQRRITDWERGKDRGTKSSKNGRKPGPRPAIRLDDTTIFATEEFAFESEDEAPPQPHPQVSKRAFTRVTSRSDRETDRRTPTTPKGRMASPLDDRSPAARMRAVTPRTRLDDGVGKARSWANFDRFPIDFDITPLPSGVYLSNPVIKDLGPFLDSLRGEHAELKPLHAFGVHLHSAMDLQEASGVMPIVLDGVWDALSAYIDDPGRDRDGNTREQPLDRVLAPLTFFRDLLARADHDTKSALHAPIAAFGDRLEGITLTARTEDRAALGLVLLVRYTLLQITIVATPPSVSQASQPQVPPQIATAATHLFRLLLTYGFDRTLKPIRRVLRGEVDTPDIADQSVAMWVAVGHVLSKLSGDVFASALLDALETRYAGEIGPLAAERVWFLIFGLCALNQFDATGAVAAEYIPYPRWGLVKKAIGLIKVAHSQEAEEAAHLDQLQGRDRYIKTMVARCLRLSAKWAWSFDRQSFTVATRDLGMIFKERQHRNLPTEPAADFPPFIAEYDISLAATDSVESARRASAFELYLRLASVAASDVIASAEELSEAHSAERDVQRLIMSIFPLSAVPFTRVNPPTARQLAALVNRYATMTVACYFSPSLLPWLLSNSAKWIDFKAAGFESRQVVIRGLMYLAVAVRHHDAALDPVVARLADILAILQSELDTVSRGRAEGVHPTKVEIERTMVLVVTAFREIILHPGYAPRDPVYPDPTLLHESWLGRIFDLDLAKDVKSGLEIVSTIQAYLDGRVAALPKRAAAARKSAHESMDDFSLGGFDFDAVDLAALGALGGEVRVDPIEEADARFAAIVRDTINPKIYRLLNDMLPPVLDETEAAATRTDRQVLVSKLTKCWSDCAAVVVVEHRLLDWSSYVGPFGQQSWSRLGNEAGRLQVGLHFMLNVATLDPSAWKSQEEEFLALFFHALVADRLTIQHKYVSAVLALPGALDHALLGGVRSFLQELFGSETDAEFSRTSFFTHRPALLAAIFANIAPLLRSRHTPSELKSLVYRCINVLVSAMASTEAGIETTRVIPRESYRVFVSETVMELRRAAGEFVTPLMVPGLKALSWVKM